MKESSAFALHLLRKTEARLSKTENIHQNINLSTKIFYWKIIAESLMVLNFFLFLIVNTGRRSLLFTNGHSIDL